MLPNNQSPSKKLRRCPHCKSTKGFSILTELGGHQTTHVTFQGKIISIDRQGTDKISKYGLCLNCEKPIDAELLKINQV